MLGVLMYKYRSKCRWNMLLHIDGEVIEIRPGEQFESKGYIDSRYLELITKPPIQKKRGRPKTKLEVITFEKELNASSST
jgi:hypothetical protein